MNKRVIEGVVTSRFGGRKHPIEGIYKVHQGVDIAAPIGTPIYCPCAGVVSSIYRHKSGGLTLIIRSTQGELRFGFCHLKEVIVEQGSSVTCGEMVAKSGNSGKSTGAHLHFSVKSGGRWYGEQYIGGKYVNSEDYLEFNV